MMRFTVPCIPVAQPRQRHRAFVANGRVNVQNYTPTNSAVNAFKATIRLEFAKHPWTIEEGPVAVNITAFFPRPKRMRWKRRPMPRERYTSKPDLDNLEKSCLDALSGLAFFDDAQVCRKTSEKWYCSGDEQPHVEIEIIALNQETELFHGTQDTTQGTSEAGEGAIRSAS